MRCKLGQAKDRNTPSSMDAAPRVYQDLELFKINVSSFRVLLIILLTAVLHGLSGQLTRAEDSPAAGEQVDPDVLRKVRKLIQATVAEDTAAREAAWMGLKDMGNLAIPGLLALYRQSATTLPMMRSILIAIGDSKDPRSGPALAELLSSNNPGIRRDAARAMGDSSYKEGRTILEKVAGNEKEEDDVRLFAAVAAVKLGSETAQEILRLLAMSAKPEIRSRAVFALGKHGGVAQLPTVVKALEDTDRDVREDAVEALRLLGKEEAWGGLVKAASDSDYKIRNAAMDALRSLSGEKIDNNAEAWQNWWVRRSANTKAGNEGSEP